MTTMRDMLLLHLGEHLFTEPKVLLNILLKKFTSKITTKLKCLCGTVFFKEEEEIPKAHLYICYELTL